MEKHPEYRTVLSLNAVSGDSSLCLLDRVSSTPSVEAVFDWVERNVAQEDKRILMVFCDTFDTNDTARQLDISEAEVQAAILSIRAQAEATGAFQFF